MDMIRRQPGISVVAAFVIGLFIGLVVLGWWLVPLEWTGAGPKDLTPAEQANYLRLVAELYSHEQTNPGKFQQILSGWSGVDTTICQTATTAVDPAEKTRLEALAQVVNPQGCAGVAVSTAVPGQTAQPAAPTEEEEGGGFLPILVLVLLLFVIVAAIWYVMNRRNAMITDEGDTSYADLPDNPPMMSDANMVATPLARFQTTYVQGHDSYDDSFSIENSNGDFLGECGVGISESLGTDTPKNVTAFEIWLFDKNDIRTVTKVIMSDHAFFDEAIKAKLATKGEQVLARENETIVLETASLIINAEIKEMRYGTGTLPPESYFERFTIELSAWAKEGNAPEPDIQGRVDEIMNY